MVSPLVLVALTLTSAWAAYRLASFRTTSWLAVAARFIILIYTGLMWISLVMFDRASFLSAVLNRFGVGFPMPERDYGDVCQIYTPDHPSGDPFFNVTDRIDIFVIAHSLGWFVKAFIIRDLGVSWICSILFEIIELCFAHLLPNFNECWWDSVIFDVFGCNLIGIHAADFALSALNWEKHDFVSRAFGGKRINFRFLFAASLLVALVSLIDLNFFFLKFILFIPTTHWLCHVRTYSLALISAPASLEMYKWAKARARVSFIRSCPSAVIGITALATECVLCFLYRNALFATSPPTPLATILLVVSLVYITGYAYVRLDPPAVSKRA